MNARTGLGVAPMSTVPYLMYIIEGLSLGTASFIVYCVFVVAQLLLVRYPDVKILLQIPVSLLFSVFIDVLDIWLFPFTATGLIDGLVMLVIAVSFTALGVTPIVSARLVPVAPDGMVQTLSQVFHCEFGKARRELCGHLTGLRACAYGCCGGHRYRHRSRRAPGGRYLHVLGSSAQPQAHGLYGRACEHVDALSERGAAMRQLFGIDIGGTSVKWAIVNENYEFGDRGSIPTAFVSADQLVDALAALVGPYRGQVVGVGISAPGGIFGYEVDPDGTIHRGGALPYMDGFPLGRALRERLGLPVTVVNDGKSCALGEYAAGALRGVDVGCVAVIGTGIGGGIVVDGRVLTGAGGFAGEFSFLSNNVSEPLDHRDTFATLSGWHGLQNLVAVELGISVEAELEALDGRRIFELLEHGSASEVAAVQRGLDAYAELFDRVLVNLQCVIDPAVFAIGGGISCHPALFEALDRKMDDVMAHYTGFLKDMPRPHVVPAQLGNDANIYGAVATCLQVL